MGFKPKRAIDTEITMISEILIFSLNRIPWCYTRKSLNFPANLHVSIKRADYLHIFFGSRCLSQIQLGSPNSVRIFTGHGYWEKCSLFYTLKSSVSNKFDTHLRWRYGIMYLAKPQWETLPPPPFKPRNDKDYLLTTLDPRKWLILECKKCYGKQPELNIIKLIRDSPIINCRNVELKMCILNRLSLANDADGASPQTDCLFQMGSM